MKKLFYVLVFLLYCAFLTGYGRDEEDRTEEGIPQEKVMEYRDIRSDIKAAFNMEGVMGKMVSMQFYRGERVMIWAARNNKLADIYLY